MEYGRSDRREVVINMVVSDQFKRARAHRRYLRYKARNPPHLYATGHRWKGEPKGTQNPTGLCLVCGQVRNIQILKCLDKGGDINGKT